MTGFLGAAQPWFKALHIVAAIAWMAGLLYLPRLYVYHCAAAPDSQSHRTFAVMERRLLHVVTTPAMIAALAAGLLLALDGGDALWRQGWWHAKLPLAAALLAVHGLLARWRLDFARGRNRRSQRFYRLVNEVPTVLMIAIVVLAVVKPF